MKWRSKLLFILLIFTLSLGVVGLWGDKALASAYCCFPPGWPGGTCQSTTPEDAILLSAFISGCYGSMATCTSNCAY